MSCIPVIWCLFILGFGLCLAGNDSQPKHLECYNDYLKEITCTWNVDPNTNCSTDYSLQYELVNITKEVTEIKTLPGSICQSSIMTQTLVFYAIYEIRVIFKGNKVLSKCVTPSQSIKPLAPHNLKINTSEIEPLLVWDDDYKDNSIKNNLEYQVAYMRTGGNWKMINTTTQKILVLHSLLDPGYTYHIKVRSKPLQNYAGVWSDWSLEYVWPYGSSELISTALIVLVCIIVPLPVALCFFGFKLAKKSWWEKIPSPQKSALSKESFDKFQKFGHIVSENMLDNCKVEKVSCTNKLPCFVEKNRVGSPDDQLCTVNINFPTFEPLTGVFRSNEKFPFPPFPGFNFPLLTDSLSPFPLLSEDLSLGVSDSPGYSLFNSVSKDKCTMHEEDKCHPFTGNEEGDSPLMLSTYSLSPGADSKVTGSSEEVGYKAFSSCVSTPWNPEEQQSAETIQTNLVSDDIESSDYLSSDKLTFKSSNEVMPNWEWDKVHNTSCDFAPGTGTHFPLDPFPMFCENLQSLAFHLKAQEEPGLWQPCSIQGLPGTAVSLAGSDLHSHPVPSQDCCLKVEPALDTLSQGDVGQAEQGTEANIVKKNQMKYIVVPDNAKHDLSELTPYMKLSLLNVQATEKRHGVDPNHPPTKKTHLKC
ncbi:interleukin-4 receptor subunit alpha-like isoform X2 [Mustelus asterias]